MGPDSKGRNGFAVVLASIAFGDPNALVRASLRPYAAVRERRNMRKRNNEVHLRLSDEEYKKLESLSHISGNSYNSVIRKLILGKEIRQRPNVDFAALNCAISRLGTNVNQIARKANVNSAVSYADLKETASIRRMIRTEFNTWKEKWL